MTESILTRPPVILDFTSQYCLACHELAPKLEAAAKQAGVRIQPLNMDKPSPAEKALARQYRVVSTPHVVMLRQDGQVAATLTGDAPQAQVSAAVAKIK